jgi:G3E family GTPase
MNVNGVTQTAMPNANVNASVSAPGPDKGPMEKSSTNDDAATVEISEAGRRNLELKLRGPEENILNYDAAERSPFQSERKEQWINDIQNRKEIDPFDNAFQLRAVTYQFPEGGLQKSIADHLEGKTANPSLVASELGKMLKGTFSNPEATVEERAMDREIAIRNAEYIAKNYFDDEDEANAFMDLIKKAAEKDVYREKGYYVFDSSDEKHKPYCLPSDQTIFNMDAYAKQYGASMEELNDPERHTAFMGELKKNKSKWEANIIKEFNDNEKFIDGIIKEAIEKLTETSSDGSLKRLLKAFN